MVHGPLGLLMVHVPVTQPIYKVSEFPPEIAPIRGLKMEVKTVLEPPKSTNSVGVKNVKKVWVRKWKRFVDRPVWLILEFYLLDTKIVQLVN